LHDSSLQQSSDAHIQYYQNGNGNQEQYSSNPGNGGNKKQVNFITNITIVNFKIVWLQR
jgi:hypothetical protein